MNNKLKTNLTKIEKILLYIYIGYVLFAKLFFDKFLVSTIVFIIMIFITSRRKNDNLSRNYLIKEKIELIIRQFLLLCIFWNIIIGILYGDLIFEDSLTDVIVAVVPLIIFLLPFLGILKAISKLQINTNVEMCRELPQKIEPAIVAYIMQNNILDKSDISATLLDLIRRKYLLIEQDTNNGFNDVANGILNKKLIINKKKNIYDLKSHEQFLISWFTSFSDNSDEIIMSKLKKMLENSETTKSNYEKWEKLVKKESDRLDFYDDINKISKFSKFSVKWAKKIMVVAIITLIFSIIVMVSEYVIKLPEVIYEITAVCFLVHIGLSILSIVIYNLRFPEENLSQMATEEIKKWKGFIKFLKNYTLIDERKSEEVFIWEEYLVYGVAFGIAKETINSMEEAYGLGKYVK